MWLAEAESAHKQWANNFFLSLSSLFCVFIYKHSGVQGQLAVILFMCRRRFRRRHR